MLLKHYTPKLILFWQNVQKLSGTLIKKGRTGWFDSYVSLYDSNYQIEFIWRKVIYKWQLPNYIIPCTQLDKMNLDVIIAERLPRI